MDLRTLLLARTQTVVLDPDAVAEAATRPSRDVDLDRFEDDLAQRGFVMSLDLAMTVRRLPFQAIDKLRAWILETLPPPQFEVALFAGLPDGTSKYLRRVATWLASEPEQPCPWCAQVRAVVALDPCGHLVCRSCWGSGSYVGCAICHRRVTPSDPAKWVRTDDPFRSIPLGKLKLLYLAFDVVGSARARVEALLAITRRMTASERGELEAMIDVMGPVVASWLPKSIPSAENLATAMARLWTIAPDRQAMMTATANRISTSTDVLRIAVVLMGGDASFGKIRNESMPRSLRRVILGAIDRLPIEDLAHGARDHATLWKRVGEVLHPSELAKRYPNAARAFAIARGSAPSPVTPPNTAVEAALRAKDVRGAIEQLSKRPDDMLRRFEAIARIARTAGGNIALPTAAATIAIGRATPQTLFAFRAHVSADSELGESINVELVRRAGTQRMYPRAVIDRALAQHKIARGKRTTLWDVAAVHAAARANVVYVCEGTDWTMYRRRDGESPVQRLARLARVDGGDGRVPQIPMADVTPWSPLDPAGTQTADLLAALAPPR